MMKLYCDFCGEETEEPCRLIIEPTHSLGKRKMMDICGDCYNDLYAFIEAQQKEPKQ